MSSARAASGNAGPNKVLVFRLGDEEFAFDVLDVQEIIGLRKVTRLPNMPPLVRGVINLRGRIVPVMDLRRKFGLPDAVDTDKTCIIVAQLELDGSADTVSAVVDIVSEVIDIDPAAVEPPPALGDPAQAGLIQGIAKLADRVIVLLDAARCLGDGGRPTFGPAAEVAARDEGALPASTHPRSERG